MLRIHLKGLSAALSEEDYGMVVDNTVDYSGSDLRHLVQEAAAVPLRELSRAHGSVAGLTEDAIRPITLEDFRKAKKQVNVVCFLEGDSGQCGRAHSVGRTTVLHLTELPSPLLPPRAPSLWTGAQDGASGGRGVS
jgi:hypothetical protein